MLSARGTGLVKVNRTQLVKKTETSLSRRRDALRQLLTGELSHIGSDEDFESLDDEAYFGIAERESHELERIEDTLERIRLGRYGVCEDCGHNISLERLEALPYAVHCVKCQRATVEVYGR